MLKWIGYILLAALVIALITAPSQTKFEKFAKKEVPGACEPGIRYQPFKVFSLTLFSFGYVSECTGIQTIRNLQTGEPITTPLNIPKYGEQKRYIGLFGRFWKL